MLQGRTYVPMLHGRLAEMRALTELPNPTKNKILPIIKARPWLNAKSLSAAWDKITESFPSRAYALDLDETRYSPGSNRSAVRDFSSLFDEEDAFANYYDQVASLPYAVPVLRLKDNVATAVEGQLDYIEGIERGLFVRVKPLATQNVTAIAEAIASRFTENVVFIFDCGWGRDILTQAAACRTLVDSVLDVSEDFEVVVGGSSFPDSFANQGQRITISMEERSVFQEVRRNLNRGVLVYGDWGSTRPPSDPVPMRNVPRIDFPTAGTWIALRSDGQDSYETLARAALNDPAWIGDLGVWGEYMIESTASGLDPAIRSPAMAAAVRVNLHMHLHANLDDPDALAVADEPFDDI